MTVKELLRKLSKLTQKDTSIYDLEVYAYDPEFGNYVSIIEIDDDISEGVFLTCEVDSNDGTQEEIPSTT